MKFNLCYRDYEFRPTLGAAKDFEEITGKCFPSTCIKYFATYNEHIQQDENGMIVGIDFANQALALSKVLTMKEAADFLHCLAKQSNSMLRLEEIQDAVYHAGVNPDPDDEQHQPFPQVVAKVALDCLNSAKDERAKKCKADS